VTVVDADAVVNAAAEKTCDHVGGGPEFIFIFTQDTASADAELLFGLPYIVTVVS
jgi:hypothetical protein